MNREDQIRQLLEKYERQQCTPEEIRQLHQWLEQQAGIGKPLEFTDAKDKEALKNKIKDSILSSITTTEEGIHEPAVRRPWIRHVSMAAAILLCVWGLIWLTRAPREILVASTPGKIEKVILPDGSTAWLNDNSEVVYHSDFGHRRSLELRKGEVFLEVKKDPDHPFTLQAQELTTTVLGTSFSAKIIGSTGLIKVSVATGKVSVSRQKDTLGFLLPHQRLRYDKRSGKSGIDSVLSGEPNGWIGGDLFLQNASLGEVIQWLQDHFEVKINIDNNKHRIYAGEYYLQAKSDIPLPEVLKILNLLGTKDHVKFELQHQTIIIQ